MKIKIGKINWITASDTRLDASYHLNEALETKRLIHLSPYKVSPLNKVVKRIFLGARFKRVYVDNPETGYPYLTASDMIKTEPFRGQFLSKKHTSNIDVLTIRKDWILISCSGSIGRTVYTNNDFDGQVGTHDLIRVVPNNEKLKGGYVYAFLSSKFGYTLLTQGTYGGVIQHIEPHHIANLPIPLLPEAQQQHIHNLIEKAALLREEANVLLREGIEKFEELNELVYSKELLEISENALQLGFSVRKSDTFIKSIKAKNYSLRVKKIIEIWSSKQGKSFEEYLVKPFKIGSKGSVKRIDDKNFKGTDMVSQSDLHKVNPQKFKKVRIDRHSNDDIGQKGMVLFPSVGNASGEGEIFIRPTLLHENFEEMLIAGDVGKFFCKDLIDAAYLYTAMKSKAGFRIFRALIYGTNLRRPNWKLFKDINIPIKSENIKTIVAKYSISAFEKYGKANLLENQAISELENTITSWQN